MDMLSKIAAFADQHDRPRASRIINGKVRIYSIENVRGELIVVAEDVETLAQARAVLGY